mgnify:CR=1 FL=1
MNRNGLYLFTLLLEFLAGLGRAFAIAFPLFFIGIMVGIFSEGQHYFGPSYQTGFGGYRRSFMEEWVVPLAIMTLTIGVVLGYLNIFASLQSLIAGGGFLTRFVLGARPASTREREQIHEVLKDIAQRAKREVKGFSAIYILDNPFEQVNLIGTTLYISSGAVRSDNLRVNLAHEIAHLDSGDGRMVLALRRLVFLPFQLFLSGVRNFSTNKPNPKPELKEFEAMEVYYYLMNKMIFFWCALLGGGIGVWLTSWQWARFFRDADYRADAFVASLDLKDQMIEYLEQGKFYDAAVPYLLGWRPANELRIID